MNEDNVNHSNPGETFSNSGTRQWTRLLGVAGASTTAYGITSDSLGNVYTTGMTSGNLDGQVQSGTQDLFVTKYDGNGNKQWTRLLGVAGIQTLARGITSDNLGNVYTTGTTFGNLDGQALSGTQDLFVTKYDGSGNKQWTRLLGVAGATTQANGISRDIFNNLHVSGYTLGNLDGQALSGIQDLFVTKYDTGGNKQWTRLLGVAGQITQANGVAFDSSGNIYLTGRTSGNLDGQALSGIQDLFVTKYDTGGNKQWTRLLGVAGVSTTAYGITSDSLGNVYTTGVTSGNLDGQALSGTQDLFVTKYDTGGNKQWTRLLGVAGQITQANGIASDSSGNTYLTGRTSGSLDGQILSGTQDLFVTKYDSGGNKQWTRLLGIAGVSTTAYGITSDSLGDLYSTGITSGNLDGQILTGTQDLFVLKYR
ncbi:beta-propeller repeat protein [Leptospira interrogans serovar Djasiman str. LT1649]|uniref:Beta-propeller repeat protein n=3 Tax=Leptospira interrogans TaxID=173 RepID=A0AAP9W8S3_LEPIR|nr:beta-propeller repeat protein [Leptospira interrogans str. C10069]EMF41662.1 beta-propeller repeat protein [Leptospira interrogans serovar Lora str. TE 1992]EMM92094.1 beta-propeller repeat protein [Leptospira interrogans serovar Djasiman str. LT1649]EMN09878.1 beta-propeller repeat protein [Leptospira interrogans serovar Muenchen str. Brem 129]EMN61965.1 beta-propeller repeat protein [Leptospira interrogans serovar Pyrogenes str. R168]EMP05333.1 beta-propeller repeat protein [Leptospira in